MEAKSQKQGGASDSSGIKVTANSDQGKDEKMKDQKTMEEINCEEDKDKKIKTLISIVVVLAGVLIGSLFVDVIQFINGGGYSERALRDSQIFVAGDKTWVAYNDPAVEVQVLTVDEEELADCPQCDPSEVLLWLKRFMPTMVTKKVAISSPEGQGLIKAYNLKTVPAFVFSSDIENAEFFQEEARVLFEDKEGGYVLNATGLGIPVGRYLDKPTIGENDAILGNPDAPVKIVVFSDHQCPFCSKYYTQVKTVANQYGDKVALIYKDMPLDFHPQARNSALTARCAGEQNKFWQMTDVLYAQQDAWGKTEGTDTFKVYARNLGLNTAQFNQCMDDERYADLVQADFEEGRSYGISGTPSTFINAQFRSGLLQAEELKAIIDAELEKAE